MNVFLQSRIRNDTASLLRDGTFDRPCTSWYKKYHEISHMKASVTLWLSSSRWETCLVGRRQDVGGGNMRKHVVIGVMTPWFWKRSHLPPRFINYFKWRVSQWMNEDTWRIIDDWMWSTCEFAEWCIPCSSERAQLAYHGPTRMVKFVGAWRSKGVWAEKSMQPTPNISVFLLGMQHVLDAWHTVLSFSQFPKALK